MSSATLGSFTVLMLLVDVERIRAALSRCSQGSWKTIHGLFGWGVLLGCVGGGSEKGHENTAPMQRCCQVSHRGLLGC